MYLRPDEVAKVLELKGFIKDYITDKAYGFRKGSHYVYVNRQVRLGRTALVIHPELGKKSLQYAVPAEERNMSELYTAFPSDNSAGAEFHYGIAHGFSSRKLLEHYLDCMFQ